MTEHSNLSSAPMPPAAAEQRDRRSAILSDLYADGGAVGLIELRVTPGELSSCGVANVEAIARAFQCLQAGGDWDGFLQTANACLEGNWTDDESDISGAERAALAMALVRPDAVRIVCGLRLHAYHDVDHCLLVANHAATGATGLQTIADFHDNRPMESFIDWAIEAALQAGQVDLVLDMAKGGWDIVGGVWRSGASSIARSALERPDLPREMLNDYMARSIKEGSRERICLAAEFSPDLPVGEGDYSLLLRMSRELLAVGGRMADDWVRHVGQAIVSCPNWREAWPQGGSGPLAELLAAELSRSAPSRLDGRQRQRM